MKRRTLTIQRETVRALLPSRLANAHGGGHLRLTLPTGPTDKLSCIPDGCITNWCTESPGCTQQIM